MKAYEVLQCLRMVRLAIPERDFVNIKREYEQIEAYLFLQDYLDEGQREFVEGFAYKPRVEDTATLDNTAKDTATISFSS